MRRISMATRDELVAAVSERYGRASRAERGLILDAFAAVTGLHRKHAVRLLRGGTPSRRSGPRPGRRVYDVAVREALIVVGRHRTGCAASDCGHWSVKQRRKVCREQRPKVALAHSWCNPPTTSWQRCLHVALCSSSEFVRSD
jgi:hypothetical protein